MSAAEELEAWEALEAAWEDPAAVAVDVVRIRGLVLWMAAEVGRQKGRLERALDRLARAQADAEAERAALVGLCELTERTGVMAGRAMAGTVDPVARREVSELVVELGLGGGT